MSTDDGHDRDDELAAALAEIPVPDHAPGFWDRLDERLAADSEDEDEGLAAPAAPTTLARSSNGSLPETHAVDEPPMADVVAIGDAPGRRRNRARLLVAAAAVLVAAAVGGVLTRPADDAQDVDMANEGDGREVRPNPREPDPATVPPDLTVETGDSTEEVPGRTPTTPPTTAKPPTTKAPATTVPPSVGATPRSAVLAWLDVLAAEGVDASVRLTGPRSQATVSQMPVEIKSFSRELYGPWATATAREVAELPAGSVDGRPVVVVVLSGVTSPPGRLRAAAFPAVRKPEGTWLAEPFPRQVSSVTIDAMSEDDSMTPDGTVNAYASGGGYFLFSVDGQPFVRVEGESTGGTSPTLFTNWDPPGLLPSGNRLMVVLHVDGANLTAEAARITVG